MTYPSQSGYPSPYGQPQGPRQQNNLWLVGGTVIAVLVIIMTVVLLIVQSTAGSTDSGDGGDESDGTTGEKSDETSEAGPADFSATSCELFDTTKFDETVDKIDPEQSSTSASNGGSYDSISCYFYTDDYWSLSVYVYDYEDADDAISYVESDEEYYGEDSDYDYSEYTAMGDAGSVYSRGDSDYRSTTLHIAFGSLEVRVTASYDSEESSEEDTLVALEDIATQSSEMFAEYQ